MGVTGWNTVAVMEDIGCVAVAQNHQEARRMGYLPSAHPPVQRGRQYGCFEDPEIGKVQLV